MVPNEEDLAEEKQYYIMKKHNMLVGDEHEGEFDEYLLFEVNLASKMAKEQMQSVAFLEDDDDRNEILFKHHMTLRRFEHNLHELNEQIRGEIVMEEDFHSNMMTATAL